MNPLSHWNRSRLNQLNELEDLQHKLRDLVRRSLVRRSPDPLRMAQWIPVVNVSEDARGYVIKTELPEVKKEDIKITSQDGTLVITGERKFDQNVKKNHPRALAIGRFAHSFVIPNDARPARATAVLKKGVLSVHLTKNEKNSPKQLTGKDYPVSCVEISIEEPQ